MDIARRKVAILRSRQVSAKRSFIGVDIETNATIFPRVSVKVPILPTQEKSQTMAMAEKTRWVISRYVCTASGSCRLTEQDSRR